MSHSDEGSPILGDATPPGLVRDRVLFAVQNLHVYLRFMEEHLHAARQAEDEEIRALEQALEDTYGDDLWTDADVEFLQEQWGCDDPDAPYVPNSPLHSVLPRSLRYSFVMLVGFVLESELRVVCHWLARRRRLPPPEDWTQSVLSQARKYLSATFGITGVADALWSELFDLMKVRNCIAHVGGRVHASSAQARLQDLAEWDIGISVDTSERPGLALLVVEPEYCERIVAAVETFFTAIIKAGDMPPLAASRKNASKRFGIP